MPIWIPVAEGDVSQACLLSEADMKPLTGQRSGRCWERPPAAGRWPDQATLGLSRRVSLVISRMLVDDWP